MADESRHTGGGENVHAGGDESLPTRGGTLRIGGEDDPVGISRRPPFSFRFEGREVTAHPGETIAGALLAEGTRQLRTTRLGGRPRGLFCAIGACFDCLVRVDGGRPVRACLTPASPDAEVVAGEPSDDTRTEPSP